MPALQCSAVKCMYNKDNLCSKGDIQVKGDHAATENETWCSSFVEKTGMSNAYMRRRLQLYSGRMCSP